VESPGGKMLVDVKKLTSGKYIKVETCTYIHTYVLLATTSIIIDTSINTDTAVLYSVHTYIGPKNAIRNRFYETASAEIYG
jgi:hypothetical protein